MANMNFPLSIALTTAVLVMTIPLIARFRGMGVLISVFLGWGMIPLINQDWDEGALWLAFGWLVMWVWCLGISCIIKRFRGLNTNPNRTNV